MELNFIQIERVNNGTFVQSIKEAIIKMNKFADYTKSQIDFALKDIKEVLTIWRDNKNLNDRYIVKLYKEFDFLITLKQKGIK